MSTNSHTHTIACGSCKVAAQTVANPKADDEVTCPRCNRRDRFDHVMATVKKHVVHVTQKQLQEGMRRAVSGSRFIKVTTKPLGNPSFRWVALGL